MAPQKKTDNQRERFIETARQLECDEDKERFEEKLGKIAKAKPRGRRATAHPGAGKTGNRDGRGDARGGAGGAQDLASAWP